MELPVGIAQFSDTPATVFVTLSHSLRVVLTMRKFTEQNKCCKFAVKADTERALSPSAHFVQQILYKAGKYLDILHPVFIKAKAKAVINVGRSAV